MLRRTLHGFGYLAFAGMSTEAARGRGARADVPGGNRIVVIFMQGGVSHLDTFDYKPLLKLDHGKPLARSRTESYWAALEIRQHGESGQWISELLPHLAQQADDLCVLTAMHTDAQAHETAVPMFHTGHPLQARPSLGAWMMYGLGAESSDLPGFVAMNPLGQFGAKPRKRLFAGLAPGDVR